MKRLVVYCEGQSEEMIVSRLIRPWLELSGVHVARPVLAATSFAPSGQRGGFVNWPAIEFDLRQLFASDQSPDSRFTTLLDCYAMPAAVLELAGFDAPIVSPEDAAAVEAALDRHFGEPRFRAYLQRHELEALLLADMAALGRVFPRHANGLAALRDELVGIASPEDINHGPDTHPSARLASAVPGYSDLKASNAYFVLAEAGLDAVRARCPRFNA